MDSNRQKIYSPRTVLGILTGVGATILLIVSIRNYILATILGMLVAMAISGRSTPGEFAVTGFITGSVAGLYLGAGSYILWSDNTAVNMLAGMLFTGLLCSAYGYFTGKIIQFYKQGNELHF
jgi:hypothetical protein